MPRVDFFLFFRYVLMVVVVVYATVVTLQSLYGWYVWLSGPDRYISLLRRYVIVQGLRLRFKSFWGDLVICLLLCIVLILIARAHGAVARINPWMDTHDQRFDQTR